MRFCSEKRGGFPLLAFLALVILSYEYTHAGLSKEKMLFTALRDTDCQVNCTSTVKKRVLCGPDGLPYSSRCSGLERTPWPCKNWTVTIDPNRPCTDIREQFQDRPAQSLPVLSKGKRQRNRRRRKGKRGCTKTDREIFNSNLISEFAAEYYRETPKPTEATTLATGELKTSLNAAQKRIVDWKFAQLDRDKDNTLKSREVRSLKRLVKKLVKPRRCAKSFIEYCDTDQDKKIISKEWSLCLGLNLSTGHNPGLDGIEEQTTQPPRGHIVSEGGGLISSHIWNRPSPNTRHKHIESPKVDKKEEHHRSCLEERASAMKINMEDPNGQTFSPECTANGKYKKTQCYDDLCWCVDEDTGKSIHATTSFNKSLSCNMKPDREMKGCPRSQKRRFLVDLMGELKAELRGQTNGTDTVDGARTAEDLIADLEPSIVVKWKMDSLDVNKNGYLDRKELTKFKRDLRKRKKKSRKCGRNFLRYCDEDKNKKISLEEFKDCMGVNRNYHSMTLSSHIRGQNPLSKYLKDD